MNIFGDLVSNLLTALSAPFETQRMLAQRNRTTATSTETSLSYQANAHKPCTVKGCGKPRHINKGGVCSATRCSKHQRAAQAISRAKFNAGKL